MNDEDKKDILLLENFIKKTKSDKIQIKQPLKIIYHDIFNNDDKDSTIEKKSLKSKDILRAKRPNLAKTKKYNIIKESIEFMRRKSTVNFNELYEMKLKNVRNIYILI